MSTVLFPHLGHRNKKKKFLDQDLNWGPSLLVLIIALDSCKHIFSIPESHIHFPNVWQRKFALTKNKSHSSYIGSHLIFTPVTNPLTFYKVIILLVVQSLIAPKSVDLAHSWVWDHTTMTYFISLRAIGLADLNPSFESGAPEQSSVYFCMYVCFIALKLV